MKKAISGVLVIALLLFAAPTLAAYGRLATLHLAAASGNEPIVDSAGRIFYIVDLIPHAQDGFPSTISSELAARFDQRHSAQAKNMVAAYEQEYGFDYVDMTSWVGNSFSAYLTVDQIASIRQDPMVVLVSEVIGADLSSPLWFDTTHSSSMPPYTETSSWGRNSINGKLSTGTRRVYIIDSGVGYHEDLGNVSVRVNASCGTHNQGCPGKQVVGCYSHATHVAGILGAPYGNLDGTHGQTLLSRVAHLLNNPT